MTDERATVRAAVAPTPTDGLPRVRPAQPADLRRQNISAILRSVMQEGPIARADLARLTGMATGTVTKLTSLLGEAGLVRDLSASPEGRNPGRPRIPVAIDDRRYRVVGVHFGYLRTSLGLLDLNGRLVAESQLNHRSHAFGRLVAQAVDGIGALIAQHEGTVLGVGASTGGWVDAEGGRVREHHVLGWRDAPLRDALEHELALPTRVDSSFRALALAERWFGAARGVSNLVNLFVGNVVGAGFVLDGNIYRGTTSAAGSLDHLAVDGLADEPCRCGRRDCLHVVASDIAVVGRARELGLISARGTLDQLIAQARRGEKAADELLVTRAAHVGTAAGTLIELFDPQMVIVGGGVVDAPEYLAAVRRGAHGYLVDKRQVDVDAMVQPSSFGVHATAVSSGSVVLDRLYQDPAAFVPALRHLRYG